MSNTILFDNGAAYELYMGQWSQLVAEAFLGWLAPAPNLHWLDVGCGNGAFTEFFTQRAAPAAVAGVDPAEGMLAFARSRPLLQGADLRQGDAMALPFAAGTFDIAVMPLVIFFVPEPAKGVGEMARVVRPGGIVAAYSWDMDGGGFPYAVLQAEMRNLGCTVPMPPSTEASRMELKRSLWSGAGLTAIETQEITVQRIFANFEEYWAIVLGGPSVGTTLATLTPESVKQLQDRVRALLPTDSTGMITCSARANAIKGRVPN